MTFSLYCLTSASTTVYEFAINGLIGNFSYYTVEEFLRNFARDRNEAEFKQILYENYINIEDFCSQNNYTFTSIYSITLKDIEQLDIEQVRYDLVSNYPHLLI